MNAVNQFVEMARETPVKDERRPLENTFVRFCAGCRELMPHFRREGFVECAVCGTRTFHAERGQILLEFLLWLGLIVFVLVVVLRDVPW